MAIEIFSKANGSITTLIEDIKDIWNWNKIVTDDDGAVTELWVSDKVYLAVNGGSFDVKTSSGLIILSGSSNGTPYSTLYFVVKTDETLAIFGGKSVTSNRQCILISKVADIFDTDYSGYGIVGTTCSGSSGTTFTYNYGYLTPFTDKSTAVNTLSDECKFLSKSADSQTLICPIVDRSSSMYFPKLNYKICSPSASSYYKSEMNGKKYYITPYVAIEYED